jgi:hypothetical protein
MKSDAEQLDILVNRLKKININVEVWCNYPWIYLYKVNGNKVKEKFDSEHAFTIGYLPVRADRSFTFTDLKEIFKIIRKYR